MSNKGDIVGQTIKGYKFIKSIGEGKFSFVYRAENQNKVPFAIKKIKIFDLSDQKLRDKCLKEVELMKPLDHPNIIKYIDSFIQNNELYIVCEWAEKGDLKKTIREHASDQIPFEQSTIWEYMRQISSGLNHMHEKKIMHRDLKPANIFISHDGSLKIGDLGLGRVFGSGTLQAYSKVGTPLYMSPQLIKDSGYNFNADVWSLGCICYQFCELNSPFRNKQQKMSLMDLFENITKCNYKPISPNYSPELSQAIKKMIVVDPANRLNSDQVEVIAEKNMKNVKKPLLDPYIVMDDIHIKLNLLNYSIDFCKVAQKKPIHKYYFALPDPLSKNNDQLYYFLQLCYWIMALSKPDKKKDKLALYSKTNIDWKSPSNACRKLLVDLNGQGLKLQQIDAQTVIDGYGQSVCYLLNQVLNRQLIHSNFQFKEPDQKGIVKNQQIAIEGQQKSQVQEPQNQVISDQSFEDSQFEQSIFYRGNAKKMGFQKNPKLLQKIQQFDEDQHHMIFGKADEFEWKAECMRVEKKLNDVATFAKQARRKSGHQHFDTAKISTSKITDLIRSLKPAATVLYKKLDKDLQQISSGERKINESFKNVGQHYSEENDRFKELNNRSLYLTTIVKEKTQQNEKLEQKIEEMNNKITIASSDSQNNRVSEIKMKIKDLKKQIKDMEQRQGILSWQLLKCTVHQKNEKRSIPQIDFLDQ